MQMGLTTAEAAAMCPKCGGEAFVKKTFDAADGARIRVRKCGACGYRYRTREVVIPWGTKQGK